MYRQSQRDQNARGGDRSSARFMIPAQRSALKKGLLTNNGPRSPDDLIRKLSLHNFPIPWHREPVGVISKLREPTGIVQRLLSPLLWRDGPTGFARGFSIRSMNSGSPCGALVVVAARIAWGTLKGKDGVTRICCTMLPERAPKG